MDPRTRAGQHADSGTGASAQPGTSHYDVLIVGCGPVGATLANYLRRYGHSVAIFDRDKDVFYAPRAMGFDRDSMRILNELGIVEQLIESDALRPFEHTFTDAKGRVLLRFSSETLGEEYLGGPLGFGVLNMVDQPHVERCLREAFSEWPQVHSYLGYEVVDVGGVAEDRAHVCVRNLDDGTESTFTGSYLVGCDGARSLVRQSIKPERIDLGYSEEWLVVDAIVDDADYYASLPDLSTFIVDADLPGIVAKGVLGHIRFDAYLPQGIDAAPGDIEQQSRELIARFDDGSSSPATRRTRHRPSRAKA